MTDAQTAVQRLTAWIGQYGDQKQPEFIGDLSMVVLIAREAVFSKPAADTADVAYGIFPKRSDSGTPKLVKMLGDVVYHTAEDANGAVRLLQRFHDSTLEVRELKVTVGDVVKSEPDTSSLAEGGDAS